MNMSSKILPVQCEKKINYGSSSLENFWLPKSELAYSQSGHFEKLLAFLESIRGGFVCICSEKITDKKIIEKIFNLSEQIKFYILVNEYSNELDNLKGKALIRYGVKNIGSFVLVNPNSSNPKGVFFQGQFTEPSLLLEHIFFEVKNEDNVKELFRHFCYHFWESASFEILENDEKRVDSKPIDIYYDNDKFSGGNYIYGTLFDFVPSGERKSFVGKKIISLNKESQLPVEIKSESPIDLGENNVKSFLTKEEFEKQSPEFKDDGISSSIIFKWQNVPFYLPQNADEHNLYSQWKSENEKIKNKLRVLEADIENLEKRKNTIPGRLSKFFLGKQTTFDGLKSKIAELNGIDFSHISKNERDKYAQSINEIFKQIKSSDEEIELENKKAKLDEEIETLEKQLNEKQEALKKLNPPVNKSFEEKNKTDKKNLENEIARLRNQIKSKEDERNKISSNDSQKKETSSLDFSKQNNQKKEEIKKFEIQNLPYLPEKGKLFSVNGTSYLAIEFWEEYEIGKNEAQRLNAKLCVIR